MRGEGGDTHRQVNELRPGTVGSQGRRLRVLLDGDHRDVGPGQQPTGNPRSAYSRPSTELQDAGARRQVRGQHSQQLPNRRFA